MMTYLVPGGSFGFGRVDPPVLELAQHALAGLATAAGLEPVVRYDVVDRGLAFHPSRWLVYRDGALLNDASVPADAFDVVVNDLDDLVMGGVQGHALAVHAGAVERDGRVAVLPAHSGSGKTTLTAAAVAAGGRYLTDEVVVVDKATLRVEPFARPLCVKTGSRRVLRALVPEPARADAEGRTWHVSPHELGSVSSGGAVTAVVVPRYELDAGVAVEPLSRAEAIMALGAQTAFLAQAGPSALHVLHDLVRDARCATLVFSDAAEAGRVLVEMLT